MEDKIKQIADNNQLIGKLETVLYVQKAYEHGIEDVYDLLKMLRMFLNDDPNYNKD